MEEGDEVITTITIRTMVKGDNVKNEHERDEDEDEDESEDIMRNEDDDEVT